jgi:putative transposase
MTKRDPFKYFKTSPEIIRLAVMLYVRFPLSLRNVADPLHERGIDISYETVRFWWNRFGLLFATEIHKKSVNQMCAYPPNHHQINQPFKAPKLAPTNEKSITISTSATANNFS